MTEKPLEAGSGLGTASQAFAQAADCERLAMLAPEGERRQMLRALRCAWIQLGGEIRTREIVLGARKMQAALTGAGAKAPVDLDASVKR